MNIFSKNIVCMFLVGCSFLSSSDLKQLIEKRNKQEKEQQALFKDPCDLCKAAQSKLGQEPRPAHNQIVSHAKDSSSSANSSSFDLELDDNAAQNGSKTPREKSKSKVAKLLGSICG